MKQIKIICDETNNSKEDLDQGYLKIDIFGEIFVLNFIVDKDGKVTYL